MYRPTVLLFLVLIALIVIAYDKIEHFASSCVPPQGATQTDFEQELNDPVADAYFGDMRCRYDTFTKDQLPKTDKYVASDAVPMSDGSAFYYMDSQYTSCDDLSGVMTGWSVHVDEDNVLASKGLCNVDQHRKQYTTTRRTAFAPHQAGMLPHKADCGTAPLVAIGFETKNNGAMVRCRYDCAQDIETNDDAKTFYTGWVKGGDASEGENIRTTLSDQTIQCPKDTVLTSISAASCAVDDSKTLVFRCKSVNKELSKKKIDNIRKISKADPVNGRSYWVDDIVTSTQPTVFDKLGRALHPLTSATAHVYQHVDRAVKSTTVAFDGSRKTLDKVGTKATTTLTDAGNAVGKDVSKAIRAIGVGFRAVGTAGEKLRDAAADAGYETVRFVGKDVVRPVTQGITAVSGGISNALGGIASAFPGSAIKDKMGRAGSNLAQETACKMAKPVTKTGNFVMSSIRKIHNSVNSVKKTLKI